MTDDQEFEVWMRSVPPEITTDTIWRMSAYRYSLFLSFRSQKDLKWLLDTRSSGKERAHFYEYALGSTREARGWYYKCSVALPEEIAMARLTRLSRIVRILTVVVPRERSSNSVWRKRASPTDQPATPDNPAATSSS